MKMQEALSKNCLCDWDAPEMLSCALELHWKPLGSVFIDSGTRLCFPAVASVSGLYRFRVRHAEGGEARYIGEAEILSRRFQHYRTPGKSQETNIRINRFLADALSQKAEISVSIVTDTAWIIKTEHKQKVDFSNKAVRRLFENFAQIMEGDTPIESLNR
jgi:hypothetical protein